MTQQQIERMRETERILAECKAILRLLPSRRMTYGLIPSNTSSKQVALTYLWPSRCTISRKLS